jgi:hypothetical protein
MMPGSAERSDRNARGIAAEPRSGVADGDHVVPDASVEPLALADRHALLIQIANYPDVPLPDVLDALDLADVLCDPMRCGFPPAHVRLLRDEEATRASILEGLRRLATDTSEDSTVVFYFSGHGGRLGDAAYLLPFDSDRCAIEATAMATDELARELAALRARAVLLIFDCCHSGGLEAKDAKDILPVRPGLPAEVHDALMQGRGWALFASSDVDELSYVRPGARNGIFTTHLLAGLRGEHGGDGHVRVFDLFEYLQLRVVREEPRQHPVFKCALRDNFAIARLPDRASSTQSGPQERAVAAMPALRVAVRVGSASSLLSLIVVGCSLGAMTAIASAAFVIAFALGLLVLSRAAAKHATLKAIAGALAWAFSATAVAAMVLFGVCLAFEVPASLPCLLADRCQPSPVEPVHIVETPQVPSGTLEGGSGTGTSSTRIASPDIRNSGPVTITYGDVTTNLGTRDRTLDAGSDDAR